MLLRVVGISVLMRYRIEYVIASGLLTMLQYMSKKKKTKPRNSYEVNRSIRRDWGEISPVTKIIPDKRKKKEKHKKGWDEE